MVIQLYPIFSVFSIIANITVRSDEMITSYIHLISALIPNPIRTVYSVMSIAIAGNVYAPYSNIGYMRIIPLSLHISMRLSIYLSPNGIAVSKPYG